jgi:hypothetical protein
MKNSELLDINMVLEHIREQFVLNVAQSLKTGNNINIHITTTSMLTSLYQYKIVLACTERDGVTWDECLQCDIKNVPSISCPFSRLESAFGTMNNNNIKKKGTKS